MKTDDLRNEFEVITEEKLLNLAGGADTSCINECYHRAREDKDGYALQECLKSCVQ